MDPITLEISCDGLIGGLTAQAAALQRTTFTSIVREAGELTAGVFDRRGYMVAQAVTGTPGHINSMALAMKHFLAACPLETLRPGDVLITNDPWLTSGHLNDVTIASPIFRGEECIAFFASTCHTADIGGHVLSAEAHEVYEEGLQIPIMKRCEVRDDELWIDYRGSSPASRRGVNVVMNYTEAYTTYGVKVIVSPDVPNNEGAFRPLRITAPEGSILNVGRPAAVAARHVVGHFLPHVIAGALGQALPARVMAEGSANIWGIQVAGQDERGAPFTYVFFSSGGTGARATKDGLSATAFPSGVLGTPVEVIESLAPLVVERKCLRPDSGGTGKYRGGLGQTIAFRARTLGPYACSVLCDRTAHSAAGFLGGGPGARGMVRIDGVAPANPKAEQLVAPGALVEVLLPGGGGYGPPSERDPELIARDLLEGYITR